MNDEYGILGKEAHQYACDTLPSFETVEEWLKDQKSVSINGCKPIDILLNLLHLGALAASGLDTDIQKELEELLR